MFQKSKILLFSLGSIIILTLNPLPLQTNQPHTDNLEINKDMALELGLFEKGTFSGLSGIPTIDVFIQNLFGPNLIKTPTDNTEVMNPYYGIESQGGVGATYLHIDDELGKTDWNISIIDKNNTRNPSLAFDGSGNPAIAYYDRVRQDLKYAHWGGAEWEKETIESTGDARATSLGFDSLGNPAIAYYDYDNNCLKYAYSDGIDWAIEVVDNTYDHPYFYCGRISLVFDPLGNPGIAYYNGGLFWDLKYAYFNGTSWDIQTVYDDGLYGRLDRTVSLAFDRFGNPAVAFKYMHSNLPDSEWGLGYTCRDRRGWRIDRVDIGYGTGAPASLHFDPLGNPAIAYSWQGVSLGSSSLKYAYFDGAIWKITTLAADSGEPSLDFDIYDNPGISYYDNTNKSINFVYFNGTSWNIEIVDSEVSDTKDNDQTESSFAFDSLGNPVISYLSESCELKYAIRVARFWDFDNDSMPDYWEYHMGLNATDPSDAQEDKDADGMPNLWEYQTGLNATNPSDAQHDQDTDGLTNLQEYQLGLNATDIDTDDDQMPDGWEYQMGLNATLDDASRDKDTDLMANFWEYQMGLNATNPNDAQEDKDADGMPNLWEYQMSLNATDPSDAQHDQDADGLTNLQEYQLGLNATDIDTDGDQMPDGWEYQTGLNTTNPSDAQHDQDADGLTNLQEYQLGLNATDIDTDDDQMPDGWEYQMGLNATLDDASRDKDTDLMANFWEYQMGLNATNPNDAQEDKDADGMPNRWEYQMGLNATDPSDAQHDQDADGLTNLQEYQLGLNATDADTDTDGLSDDLEVNIYNTNPKVNDTDDDRVSDGEEVNTYGTDPTHPDSDGDGMDDGSEIAMGFDPLDPLSNLIVMLSVIIVGVASVLIVVVYLIKNRLINIMRASKEQIDIISQGTFVILLINTALLIIIMVDTIGIVDIFGFLLYIGAIGGFVGFLTAFLLVMYSFLVGEKKRRREMIKEKGHKTQRE